MVAGLPVEAIVAKAQELRCELIIMGHRHLTRLGRLLDPSISAKVIDQVEVPVLVGAASA
ncbi:Universal stress protein family protein [compost metagenome]